MGTIQSRVNFQQNKKSSKWIINFLTTGVDLRLRTSLEVGRKSFCQKGFDFLVKNYKIILIFTKIFKIILMKRIVNRMQMAGQHCLRFDVSTCFNFYKRANVEHT